MADKKHISDLQAEAALFMVRAKNIEMSQLEVVETNINYYFTQMPPVGAWETFHMEDVLWCVERLKELEKAHGRLKELWFEISNPATPTALIVQKVLEMNTICKESEASDE